MRTGRSQNKPAQVNKVQLRPAKYSGVAFSQFLVDYNFGIQTKKEMSDGLVRSTSSGSSLLLPSPYLPFSFFWCNALDSMNLLFKERRCSSRLSPFRSRPSEPLTLATTHPLLIFLLGSNLTVNDSIAGPGPSGGPLLFDKFRIQKKLRPQNYPVQNQQLQRLGNASLHVGVAAMQGFRCDPLSSLPLPLL